MGGVPGRSRGRANNHTHRRSPRTGVRTQVRLGCQGPYLGLLSPSGSPARVLLAWRQGRFELIVSPALLVELQLALARAVRFSRPRPTRAREWLKVALLARPSTPDQGALATQFQGSTLLQPRTGCLALTRSPRPTPNGRGCLYVSRMAVGSASSASWDRNRRPWFIGARRRAGMANCVGPLRPARQPPLRLASRQPPPANRQPSGWTACRPRPYLPGARFRRRVLQATGSGPRFD